MSDAAHQPPAPDQEILAGLREVSTATLAAQLRNRGLNGLTLDGLRSTRPDLHMAGFARTVRYLPLREDLSAAYGGGMNAQKRAIEQISIADDRENLQPEDPILLIVEDDPYFATMLCDLARDNGFKVLVATRGAEALALAHEFQPTAISLDVFLPDMLGWTVLNHFKQDPRTRHIPVQMLTLDEDRQHGLARGAFSYLIKPATSDQLKAAFARMKEYTAPRRKRLLVVEERFVSGGDDEWIAVGLTPEILRFTQDDRVLVDDRDFVGWITSCRHGSQRCCDRRRWR